jgi:hypothetical protein
MTNVLKKRVRSSSDNRDKFSSNFIFDQIIKQKIFEIEKINPIRPKTVKRELKKNVTIKVKLTLERYIIKILCFKELC